MRKFIILSIALAVSCVAKQQEQSFLQRPIQIHVSNGQDTKTELNNTSVLFVEGDAMTVYCEGVNQALVSYAGMGDFKGVMPLINMSYPSRDWFSVYPHDLTVSDDGTVSGVLSETQKAPFDPEANIMYSDIVVSDYDEEHLGDFDMWMNQAMGLVAIGFYNSNDEYQDDILLSVQLKSSVPLAGNYSFSVHSPSSISFSGETMTQVASVFESEVLLGLNEQHWVYLFMNPVAIPNASLIIRTNNHTFTYTSSEEFIPSAGALTRLPLKNLDSFSVGGPRHLKKTVVCWGSSSTSNKFPPVLQELLGNEWVVYDGGTSGERTYEIAARQGGLPIVTGPESFTLPADTEEITIGAIQRTHNVWGDPGYYNLRRFKGKLRNPCRLVGTQGEVVYCDLRGGGLDEDNYATIKRIEPGEPIEIAAYTPIETYASRFLRNADLTIILMGLNGVFGGETQGSLLDLDRLDNLVLQHREMVDYLTYPDDFLILGFQNVGPEYDEKGYSELFEAEFGSDRFLNLRTSVVQDYDFCVEWLLYSGLYQNESEIPQTILEEAVGSGEWPVVLTSDGSHPNEYGSKVMAKLIYDRMVELGYVN